MDPTPTLTFSIRTLSLTWNGNEFAVLNPTDNLTVTLLVELLKLIELIPTPFVFSVGRIVGKELLIPKVFLKMVTWVSPNEYLKSTSGMTFWVLPSITINFGAELYPLPAEEIPIEANDAKGSTFIICGRYTVGLTVLSEEKSNPISDIFVLLILPILVLEGSKIAFDPETLTIVVIPGSE